MELGDEVWFIDKDGCKAIRKATITCVKDIHGYVDFLSSRPEKEFTSKSYTVCAIKDGSYQFFEVEEVFENIDSLKGHLAEKLYSTFSVYE